MNWVGERANLQVTDTSFVLHLSEVCLGCWEYQQLFSRSVVWHHGLQHARLPCPSLSPGACSHSCPLSQWCYLTLSSSAAFSFCPKSFPASEYLPISWLFASGSQSIGASASASIFPVNSQGWFLLGLTGLISLQFKGLLRVFSNTIVWRHQFFGSQPSLWSNLHLYTTTGKTIALIIWTFVGKVMSMLFNMWPRFVITFLPRSKHFLISWLQSLSAMILEPKKLKSVTVSIVSPSICHEVLGPNATIFVF